jgi:PIN domain nuclease of toxin-antitoxin system
MSVLPIHLSHALRLARLPHHHTDPFDRLLVAQCQVEDLPLMTADAAVAAYDLELIWVGRGRAPKRPTR